MGLIKEVQDHKYNHLNMGILFRYKHAPYNANFLIINMDYFQ